MSLRIEHLIKPFSTMPEDEALELIRSVRRNRFYVRETKHKVKAQKQEAKTQARSKSKSKSTAKKYLAALSPEERAKLIEKLLVLDDE